MHHNATLATTARPTIQSTTYSITERVVFIKSPPRLRLIEPRGHSDRDERVHCLSLGPVESGLNEAFQPWHRVWVQTHANGNPGTGVLVTRFAPCSGA